MGNTYRELVAFGLTPGGGGNARLEQRKRGTGMGFPERLPDAKPADDGVVPDGRARRKRAPRGVRVLRLRLRLRLRCGDGQVPTRTRVVRLNQRPEARGRGEVVGAHETPRS